MQKILQSHSLVFRNPPDLPTHRWGASTPITVHSGLNCCPLAPLCCPLLFSDHMLCSRRLNIPRVPLSPSSAYSPLPRVHDWSTVAACHHNLSAWHQSALAHVSSPLPSFPERVSVLDSLFDSFTRILCECASHHSRRRPGSRPRRRQPLWWNDACYHALVAHNGSWRDFRRSGSPEDQARFRHLRQQFHSTCTLPPDEARSLWRAHFSSPLGTLRFQTIFSAQFLSASRLSRPCTNLADLMRPSLTTNSLLHSPSATSLHQVRTASYSLFKVSFPWWRHLLLSFFNLVPRLSVVPSAWKSSLVVPIIKRDGDPTSLDF